LEAEEPGVMQYFAANLIREFSTLPNVISAKFFVI
jgi:hypothetical protein